MNKYIKIAVLTIIGLSFFTACEDYDDLIPSEYNTILTLKKSGEQSLVLYAVEASYTYNFTVMKAGYKPSSKSSAIVSVFSDTELEEYSKRTGREYKNLPSNCYSINTKTLEFDSEDLYKTGDLSLDIVSIKNIENIKDYVLPIHITSDQDSVNSEKSLLLLQLDVIIPKVSFVDKGAIFDISKKNNKYEARLTLADESLWDFTCKIGVDSEFAESEYSLIDPSTIKLSNDGVVKFNNGSQISEPFFIEVENKSILGVTERLPLKILSISMPEMEIDESTFVLDVNYNNIPLEVEMLSTNAQEPSEGPIANLIDSDPSTYFHSTWSMPISEPHYFQITMADPISECQFDYQNRNYTNGKPKKVEIEVSLDGENWKSISVLDDGLPTGAGAIYNSPVLASPSPFKYFRFTVLETNGGVAPTFFNLAEFKLYGK